MAGLRRGADHRGAATRHQCRPARPGAAGARPADRSLGRRACWRGAWWCRSAPCRPAPSASAAASSAIASSIKTGDELEALANQFNRSAEALEESYATLEQRVERPHPRAHRIAGAADRDGRDPARHLQSPTDVQPVLRRRRRQRASTLRRRRLRSSSLRRRRYSTCMPRTMVESARAWRRCAALSAADRSQTVDRPRHRSTAASSICPTSSSRSAHWRTRDVGGNAPASAPLSPRRCCATARPIGVHLRGAPSRPSAFSDKQIELLEDLRRPGRDRHRERAPVHRAARIAGAADGDRPRSCASSRSRRPT